MSDFIFQRNRRGHFVGLTFCGFSAKSWDDIERIASHLIKKHPDSWAEIYLDVHELKYELENMDQPPQINYQELYEAQISENTKLSAQIIKLTDKAKERISSMKAEVVNDLRSVSMILTAIMNTKSSHWQKKENIRLSLEILATLPTFDKGDFFSYEDDF